MSQIDYHLKELEIALDPNNPKRVMPNVKNEDRVILDIGCGIGQSFVGLDCLDRCCIGLDINHEVLRYGYKKYGPNIIYLQSDANGIPIASNLVNLIISRVALPYTHIPTVLDEARRILKSNGRLWMTLHSRKMVLRWIITALKKRDTRNFIYYIYVLLNGYLLKYFGLLWPFRKNQYESWQDYEVIGKMLKQRGFTIEIENSGNIKTITGTLNVKVAL